MTDTGDSEWSSASATDTNRALDEARRWIEACLGERFPSDNFRLAIRDGVLLCRLANVIQPGIINVKKMHAGPAATQFIWLENLNYFISACKQLGLRGSQLFDPSDVTVEESLRANMLVGRRTEQERQLRNVAITLYWLGRTANRSTAFTGPQLNLNAFKEIVQHVPQMQDGKLSRSTTPDGDPDRPPIRRSSSAAELKLAFLGRPQSATGERPTSRSSYGSHSRASYRDARSPSVDSSGFDGQESLAICIDIGTDGDSFGFSVEGGTEEGGQTRVSRVDKGSPAERAGLQVGDLLFWVNGETIAFAPHRMVVQHLDACEKERNVTLGIRRQAREVLTPEPTAEKPPVLNHFVPPMEEPVSEETQAHPEQDDKQGLEKLVVEEETKEEDEEMKKLVVEEVVEEEAVAEVIVQEETGPENMARALEDFLAQEGRQPSTATVEETSALEDEVTVLESTAILKGFSTHLATVGAATGAIPTREEREKVDEVCTVQTISEEQTSSGEFMASPHSGLTPTVFVAKPKEPVMPAKDNDLGRSTDDITRLGLEAAAAAKVVDVTAQKAEVKRQRWESVSGRKDSTSSPSPSPLDVAEANGSGDNLLVAALMDLQKEHSQELGDEEFQFLCGMLRTKEFQGAMEAQEQMPALHSQVDEAAARETSASPVIDEIQWPAIEGQDEGEDMTELQKLINTPYLR